MPLVLWDVCSYSSPPKDPPSLLWSENRIPLWFWFSNCGLWQGIQILAICNYFGPLWSFIASVSLHHKIISQWGCLAWNIDGYEARVCRSDYMLGLAVCARDNTSSACLFPAITRHQSARARGCEELNQKWNWKSKLKASKATAVEVVSPLKVMVFESLGRFHKGTERYTYTLIV